MMLDPGAFIAEQRDKPYADLIQIRDELIADIKAFEADRTRDGPEWMVKPSPDVIYHMNKEYLARLRELIAEREATQTGGTDT